MSLKKMALIQLEKNRNLTGHRELVKWCKMYTAHDLAHAINGDIKEWYTLKIDNYQLKDDTLLWTV